MFQHLLSHLLHALLKSFWYNYEYQGDSNITCEGEKCTPENCCKAVRDYTPIITIIIVLIILSIIGYVVYNEYFKGSSISGIDIN